MEYKKGEVSILPYIGYYYTKYEVHIVLTKDPISTVHFYPFFFFNLL